MKQPDLIDVRCPRCGRIFAGNAKLKIACPNCEQMFVADGSESGAPALPLPPLPSKKKLSHWVIAAIVLGALCTLAIPSVAVTYGIILPTIRRVREEQMKAKCSENLRQLTAAMITYSNTNNGKYPRTYFNPVLTMITVGDDNWKLKIIGDAMTAYAKTNGGHYPESMGELIRASTATGLVPSTLICQGSTDTPLIKPLATATDDDLVGHCSWVYVAKGLDSKAVAADVLLYQSPAKDGSKPIHVLYGDGHVGEVQAKDQLEFMKVAKSSMRPVHWP